MLGCAIADTTTDDVVITVGAPGTLELAVLDGQGAPLSQPIFHVDRERRSALPGEGGLTRLPLPPGSHVLVVNAEGRRARYETVFIIEPEEVTRLGTILLQRPAGGAPGDRACAGARLKRLLLLVPLAACIVEVGHGDGKPKLGAPARLGVVG